MNDLMLFVEALSRLVVFMIKCGAFNVLYSFRHFEIRL